MRIPTLSQPSRFATVTSHVWSEIGDKNMSLTAAGVAFFGLLGIFPGLAALIAILGLVADPVVVDSQLEMMRGLIPEDAFVLLDAQIAALISASPDTLGWASTISILAALWSARAAVAALIQGLNTLHGQPDRHGVIHALYALMLTAALICVVLVALSAVVISPIVLALVPLGPWAGLGAEVLRWLVALIVIVVALGMVYRYGPNKAHTGRVAWFSPGAIMVILLWSAASIAFSTYLANFGNYNEVYGSLGAVIALLMWFYISAFLILLGAALNVGLQLPSE